MKLLAKEIKKLKTKDKTKDLLHNYLLGFGSFAN